MTKYWIVVYITLLFLLGCSTSPNNIDEVQPSIVINNDVADTSVLFAERAYRNDDKLFIRFKYKQELINSFTILPKPNQTFPVSASTTLNLQRAIEQFNDLPFTQLLYIDSIQWFRYTQQASSIPVAGVALWREFRDRLITRVTPEGHGKGIVIEFLKQDELFFYFNEQGLLTSVALSDKPAELKVDDTHKFSELISAAKPLLQEYISAANGADANSMLFNTADTADFGYPFIYINSTSGQVVFLRRMPDNPDCCRANDSMITAGVVHIGRSHIESFIRQPFGSIARLFTLVYHKVIDTVTPKPIALLNNKPVPPIKNQKPMDANKWEQELSKLASSPLTQGSIEYLIDGEAFFPRLIDAIQSAQKSIDIRTYIFDNDDYALKIANLLKQRSKEVRVRILVDGFGTISAASAKSASMPKQNGKRPKIIQYLKNGSDIEVRTVLNPWLTGDHSKTILIDNQVAYLGGMNIGREYRYDWHDLMTELRGPVVDAIQTDFEKAWRLQSFLGDIRATLYRHGPPINDAEADHIPIRLLSTKPGDSQILRTQLAAIARAKQRIYIQNAYFTSDDIIFELAQARRRGVDVRIIIPHQSDNGIIDRSNVSAINAMLKNGIRVYIYPGESHIKGAVYDGWICLGSANFDQLSLRVNKELNIATSNQEAVQGFLDKVMLPDFEKSVELKEQLPKKWSDFIMEAIADHL